VVFFECFEKAAHAHLLERRGVVLVPGHLLVLVAAELVFEALGLPIGSCSCRKRAGRPPGSRERRLEKKTVSCSSESVEQKKSIAR